MKEESEDIDEEKKTKEKTPNLINPNNSNKILESQKINKDSSPSQKSKSYSLRPKSTSTVNFRNMASLKKKLQSKDNIENDSDIVFTDEDQDMSFTSSQESISFDKNQLKILFFVKEIVIRALKNRKTMKKICMKYI